MKQFFFTLRLFLVLTITSFSGNLSAQTCSLNISTVTSESRCKATGSITVTVTGGSGNYNYTVTGTGYSTSTSTNIIDGLKPGVYTVKVKDITNGCTVDENNISVGGNYQDPRFNLAVTDVSCVNASNGSITVSNLQYGQGPFTYSIVAPSTSGTGTSNMTGVFNNLPAGDYFIRLADSCGGIQTRVITIASYSWTPAVSVLVKAGCDSVDVTLSVSDNKGKTNNGDPVFNGFMYGATVTPGDTTWSVSKSFRFYKGTARSARLIVKDGCGNYQFLNYTDNAIPNVNASVSISNMACGGFTATVTGQQNLTNPTYALYNSSNTLIASNATGVFNSIAYGSYCIGIRDNCYDTTFNRCFTVSAPLPTVGASVSISNLVCSGFNAAINGQQNLTSPQYCLYDSTNTLVSCNSTGMFTNIPYGPYCINITDGCSGTVITRCFTQRRLMPIVGNTISYSNLGCTTFTASIGGQANITNPQYCIYDTRDSVIVCNATGVFNNLPYGSYCMHIQNDPACYDTVLVRCFTVAAPVPGVGTVAVSNRTCTAFTAKIGGQANLTNPQYCLYDSAGNLLFCNTNGQFDNLAYGSYCMSVKNDGSCFDTTFQRCFSAVRPVPSIGATVNITNRACSTYTAAVTGQANLTNPFYYLYDSGNNPVDSNATGTFNNIPYGAYCIKMVNTCYDTSMTRCFSATANPVSIGLVSTASCTIGKTNIAVTINNGIAPFSINIYNPWGALVSSTSSNATSTTINNLPGLPSGYHYEVYASGACGGVDSAAVTPISYTLSKSINANSKCPGGMFLNGSGDLLVNAQFSGGTITPAIISKNGSATNISFTTQSGSNFTFSNMQPATYIIQYTLQNCGTIVYDTFNLKSYTYPNLDQSAVYQCNNNNFSVSAAASGGIAPFSYEVIGSSPSFPAIMQSPQPASTFAINNGTTYSLVRLRVIDACGNATINDASILPLANTIITASSNCYFNSIDLTVDSVANATYSWYKKTSDADSVLIDNNQTHTIPYLLPSDTGTYVNVMSVNNGCLQKVSSFQVTGACGGLLASNGLKFTAAEEKENVQLKWVTARAYDATAFVIEKSTDGYGFTVLAKIPVNAANNNSISQYMYSDVNVTAARNFYRIRIIQTSGKTAYSNVEEISKKAKVSISVMPNPVADVFNIKFQPLNAAVYTVMLVGADGKTILNNRYTVRPGDTQTINRPHGLTSGIYYLATVNTSTQEKNIFKLFFK